MTLRGGSWCACTVPNVISDRRDCIQNFPDTIGRDALAALMGHIDEIPVKQAMVLDVRRHDERALYGSIPGMYIPALGISIATCLGS